MQKHELANQLRQRQYAYGMVERRIVDSLSDDDIIDSYVTCSCCGEKQVEGARLQSVIMAAKDSDSFLDLCSQQATVH